MSVPRLEVLNEKELDDIHSAAIQILEDVGFKTDSSDVVELMKKAGIKQDEGAIHVPRRLVEKTIGLAPKTIPIHTPSGSPWRVIGGGDAVVISGHQAVFVLDYGCDDPRPGRKEDNVQFTRLANETEEIDGIGVQVYPQDVPKPSSLVHAMEAMLLHSKKPMFFAPERPEVFKAILELAKVASGSGDLGRRPFLIVQPSPISPLFWLKDSAACIIGAAREKIPCAVLPQIIPGMSGPVTLAGTLALHHAEALLALVITQLASPGAPTIYPGAWVTFDMSQGGIDIGSPEKYLLSIATPQLARRAGIPCMAAGPDANAHGLDIQNGAEKALSAAADMLSGIDVIVNTGMISGALTVSLEQVLVDAEIVSIVRRVKRGIEVNENTIALEAVKRVGIKGEFLTDQHTLDNFRKELRDTRNRLFQRMKFDKWKTSGAPDVAAAAHEFVKKALSRSSEPVLDGDRISRMARIVSDFDSAHGNSGIKK
jgi:trimethylamine--corrinoid protein Co-methyltransferase